LTRARVFDSYGNPFQMPMLFPREKLINANDFCDYRRKVAKRLVSLVARLQIMENQKLSHKETLSADAKLIIALLKKQPQTRKELCKSANIHISTFYRIISQLKGRGIIRETEDGFALWTYIELEKAIENALDKLEKSDSTITFNKIASEVGAHPSEIESIIYPIAKKRGMEVRLLEGEKVITREGKGVVLF